MEVQSSYILRELKELLKHRKFKQVLHRIERLLDKQDDYEYFSIEFHLTLRLLQVAAVNSLFQRNILKKYKYSPAILEFLVEIALRNLNYCHQTIRDKIREKTIFGQSSSPHTTDSAFTPCSHTNAFFPSSHANSIDQHFLNQNRTRNYSIKIGGGLDSDGRLKKFLRKFFEAANRTVVLIVQSFSIYRLDADEGVFGDYVKNVGEAKFGSISGSMSLIQVQLFHAKTLFLSQERQDHLRCQQAAQEVVERLVDTMHQINIANCNADKEGKQHYGKWLEQCQKLMAIALSVNNKAKMKLGREAVALTGIELFQSYLQGLPTHLKNFKRLMLPQLYLQEQFLRYRADKTQLAEIVGPFFAERCRQVEAANRQREWSRHRLVDFYNKRAVQAQEKSAPRVKPPLMADLSTAKSIMATTRHKNNLGLQTRAAKERSSDDAKNNKIVASMILADIADLNSNYLKHRKPAPSSAPRRETLKSSFYKSNTQTGLKRQAVSSRKWEGCGGERDREEKLYIQEQEYKNYVGRQKDRLTRRKRELKLQAMENEVQVEQELTEVKENLNNGWVYGNRKYTQEKSAEADEKEVRRNVVAITARHKSDLFLGILLQNREVLGLRKVAQKIELMRKKQQEKMKSMNGRPTFSISRDQVRGSFVKFQVIAKELLRKHISFANDRSIAPSPSECQQAKKKAIQASYVLGQRSIEAVKQKLQSKISKNQNSVDKYMRNQEIFKLKLKKLGTPNFILRKSDPKPSPEATPAADEILE